MVYRKGLTLDYGCWRNVQEDRNFKNLDTLRLILWPSQNDVALT